LYGQKIIKSELRGNGDYEIPQRNGVDWKKDLKFVSKLDFMLGDGKTLTKKELQMCNQLYEFYSKRK
tara:strand:- start:940 stop:1140 length:201 start_codon:yes stop_codon:yes gene_type:complete